MRARSGGHHDAPRGHVDEPASDGITRRTALKRGTVAFGAAAMIWTTPKIRTTALSAAGGTPPPAHPPRVEPKTTEPSPPAGPTDPGAVMPDDNGGTLPFTGTDPRGLLVAGGATLAAGSAIVGLVKDPAPSRGES